MVDWMILAVLALILLVNVLNWYDNTAGHNSLCAILGRIYEKLEELEEEYKYNAKEVNHALSEIMTKIPKR